MSDDNARIAKHVTGWFPTHIESKCDGRVWIRCGACGAMGHGNCYGDGTGAIQILCGEHVSCCEESQVPDYLNDANDDYLVLKYIVENWQHGKRYHFLHALQDVQKAEDRATDKTTAMFLPLYYQPGDYSRAALLVVGK